jgi:hypothetical protein
VVVFGRGIGIFIVSPLFLNDRMKVKQEEARTPISEVVFSRANRGPRSRD